MQTRRAQKPISIRSDRAARRLALLTSDGRSQAEVIEQALDRMPEPEPRPDVTLTMTQEEKARFDRIMALVDELSGIDIPSVAEFDAMEYDQFGDLR